MSKDFKRLKFLMLIFSVFITSYFIVLNSTFAYSNTEITLKPNESINLTLKLYKQYTLNLQNKTYSLVLNSIDFGDLYNSTILTLNGTFNAFLTKGPTVSFGIPVNKTHRHLISFKLIRIISKTEAEFNIYFTIKEIPPSEFAICMLNSTNESNNSEDVNSGLNLISKELISEGNSFFSSGEKENEQNKEIDINQGSETESTKEGFEERTNNSLEINKEMNGSKITETKNDVFEKQVYNSSNQPQHVLETKIKFNWFWLVLLVVSLFVFVLTLIFILR